MSAVEGVRMMLRLLWRACGVVWARRLGAREEVLGVGVVGSVMRAWVVTVLKAAVRP